LIRLLTFFLLLSFSPLSWGQSDLTLSGGVINSVNDFQVGHENWARVKFAVKNFSKRPRTVKIQFKHASAPEAVYEYEMVVPPSSSMSHQFPVAMGSSAHNSKKNEKVQKGKKKKKKVNRVDSTYKLSLMEKKGDRYLPVKGAIPLECVMDFRDVSKKPAIALFTDETVEIGNLSNRLGYGDSHFRMTYVHKGRWAEHWSEYSAFDTLVFLDPVFDDNHPLILRAVKDYIKMGGTVIFAHHNGINNAAKSQFEEILPIIPLQNREVNQLPELRKFIGSKELYSEMGMTFVDSSPKEGTYVPCAMGELPIIAWKKMGLGLVGAITLSPTQDAFQQGENFKLTWRYLFKHIQRPADISLLPTNDAKESVNMLNGLTIPGPSVILKYMLIYLVMIVVVFVLLSKFKKPILGWGVAIVISFGMTAVIFNKAYSSADGSKNRTAAVFSQIPVVDNAPAVQVYSIFSKNNEELDFKANIVDDRFRKLPKVKANFRELNSQGKGSYKAAQIQEVITGSYSSENATLKGLKIQGLSARTFTKISRSHISSSDVANLNFGKEELSITSSEFPAELLRAEQIYLCGNSGLIPMELSENKLTAKANSAVHGKADEYLRKLLNSLKFRSPVLCYSLKGSAEDNILDDSFEVNGMNLYMAPLAEDLQGEVFIPGEFTALIGQSTATYIFRENKWNQALHMGGKTSTYEFAVKVPLGYEDLNISELVVDLEYINQSGNILLAVSHGGKKATKNKDGFYHIPVSPKDIRNGQIEITLISDVKVQLTDNLEIHKANSWTVKHLKVGLKGTFDKQHKELRF
jgi:hypothetical protein